MFFEGHHSTERNFFEIREDKNNKGFPLHIHRAYECYAVTQGEARVTIDGREHILQAGEAVLVFPYQSHEYKTAEGTSTWVCIFSPDLVPSFDKKCASNIPKDARFPFSPPLSHPASHLLKKALCYEICGIFDDGADYIKKPQGEATLLTKLLTYIAKDYAKGCTLESISSAVGYDYAYVSKYFKRMTGISFKNYLNGLRISEACRLLLQSELSVREIGEACGYGCTRSFHREFLKSTGKTPTEYRKTAV